LMTACISMLLKSRASLTCFWACFLPGRAKDLSAPRYTPADDREGLKYVVSLQYTKILYITCVRQWFNWLLLIAWSTPKWRPLS
jgi:hypothetical protein